MFHHLWACNGAVLVDVTHQEHGDFLLFGDGQQPGSALLHLADSAGRRRNVSAPHGLDGINDHEVGPFLFDQTADLVHVVFSCQKNIVLGNVQARCPQLHLPDRFLTGDIENGVPVRDGAAELKQHGGFAHAGLAAEQHNTTQHNAAPQHAVQFSDAGYNPAFLLGGADFRQTPGRQGGDTLLAGCGLGRCSAGFGGFGNDVLAHGIPAAAAGAAPHPAGACLTALGADIDGFQFGLFHCTASPDSFYVIIPRRGSACKFSRANGCPADGSGIPGLWKRRRWAETRHPAPGIAPPAGVRLSPWDRPFCQRPCSGAGR